NSKDEACVTKVVEMNVRQAMREIREKSPYLARYLDEGKVGLAGALYDVATGKVTFLEKYCNEHHDVKAPAPRTSTSTGPILRPPRRADRGLPSGLTKVSVRFARYGAASWTTAAQNDKAP